MISTPDLIESLATGLRPTRRGLVARRMALGLCIGVALTAALVLLAWGPRPDLAAAVATPPFWMKFAFTGSLCLAGLRIAGRLARPDGELPRGATLAFAAVLGAMTAMAAVELLRAPEADYGRLVMGATSATCPWLIALLAIPLLAAILWAMRAMAPTQLTLAGAAAGLAAGGASAFVYAVSCDESAMPFVLVWYGLGIALPTAAGAMLGNRVLRW